MTIAAILLAAGASSRMGSPKPLIPWGDQSLLAWEIDQLMASCVDEIVVVLGSHAEEVRRSLGDGARYCVFNQRWQHGRSTSLVKGAGVLLSEVRLRPDATVIQNVDQPTRADIIDRLVDELFLARVDAVQPSYEGHGGHPVVLAGHVLPLLLDADDVTLGLRGVLKQHPPLRIEMDDEPVVALDLDTPDRLPLARSLLGISEAP
jgi:molybdenum cofactor cytidylyltransferase